MLKNMAGRQITEWQEYFKIKKIMHDQNIEFDKLTATMHSKAIGK